MSGPTKSPSAKRLRLTNEPEEPPPDIAKTNNPTMHSDSDELLERIDTKSLLLQLLQTDAGAADLTNALKDPQIRGLLKARGLKIHAADNVGYNSLPLELRDQIRNYVIADVMHDECFNSGRRCSPRLSSYACVDAEWKAAVEAITFRSLRMDGTIMEIDQDLNSFMRNVVGNRRQYLQLVYLPCLEPWELEPCDELDAGIAISAIQRLFNGIKQWQDTAMPDGGRRLKLGSFGDDYPVIRYTGDVQSKLVTLPSVPYFTSLSISGTSRVRFEVVLGLLGRLPQLQHIMIECCDLNFLPGGDEDDDRGQSEHAAQVSIFFADLSHYLPNLESLDVATNMEYMNWRNSQYRSELISYSQKLQRLSLRDVSHEAIRECLTPFRTENFDPHAPPHLSWPNLTHLNLFILQDDRYDNIEDMREVILIVGRAIRRMPRIKRLQMEICFVSHTYTHDWRANGIFFTLDVFWDDTLNGSRAALFAHQRWYDHRSLRVGPLNVALAMASEEVRELWGESLLTGANAVLEVDVESEDDSDSDDSAKKDPEETSSGEDEMIKEDSSSGDEMDEDE